MYNRRNVSAGAKRKMDKRNLSALPHCGGFARASPVERVRELASANNRSGRERQEESAGDDGRMKGIEGGDFPPAAGERERERELLPLRYPPSVALCGNDSGEDQNERRRAACFDYALSTL